MKQYLKKIGLILFVIIVAIQFFQPEANKAKGEAINHISKLYNVPSNVEQVLIDACYDCHSNNTHYPWYSNIQPVAWWLNNHVTDGKKHLNFDEFASYKLRKQYHKLEEVIGEVKEGEMPLKSYTLIHSNAKLTTNQQQLLTQWANNIMDTMKAKYPIDSLVKPKR
jgi:Haem-binding domain